MDEQLISNDERQQLLPNMQQPASDILLNSTDSYLTPLQLGRLELYELIPFISVFGMHLKSKNVSRAFVSYASGVQNSETSYAAQVSSVEMEAKRKDADYLLAELDAVMITKPLLVAILVSGMSQFSTGYNTGVLNSLYLVSLSNYTTTELSFAVAAFAFGGSVGSFASSAFERFSRRGAIIISSTLALLGSLIQMSATGLLCISIGRLLVGIASGISTALLPIYLGELAPPTLRGCMGTFTKFSFVFGILLSYLLALPFADEHSWRYAFTVVVAVSFLQLIFSTFLVESPIWLLLRNQHSEKARKTVKQMRGLRYGHEIDTEINHILHASRSQSCTVTDGVLAHMIQDKKIRKLLICILFLQMSGELSGISAIFYYSAVIFDGLADPLLSTTIIGVVNVTATYLAFLFMRHSDRRTLVLCSTGGMLVSLVALVFSVLGYLNPMLAVWFVVCYVLSYGIGLGSIPWLTVVEMFEAKYVKCTMLVSCQVNWVCNFIVALSFPYALKNIGAYSFVPFTVVLMITMGVVLAFLPETKGATQDELRFDIVRSLSSMFALSDSSSNDDYASCVGNIDVEWRRAMDDLRRQEAEEMISGTYNYGFQPIEQKEEERQHHIFADKSDWKSHITGGLDI